MTEAMVIDTNVLEHVFDPANNTNGHIERFLEKFTRQRKKLCIDGVDGSGKSRILDEYKHRLGARLSKMDEQDRLLHCLRYFLLQADRVAAQVNLADGLGSCLVPKMNRVMAERSDQVFVYVACALDSVMVSNNRRHVTDLRQGLRQCARKARSNNSDFVSSVDAEAAM